VNKVYWKVVANPSRRDFLIVTGAALAFPGEVALLTADAALLADNLTPRERRLLRSVLQDYPDLAPETALEMLREGGA
jgi:hypothetical protein